MRTDIARITDFCNVAKTSPMIALTRIVQS
jgi:hypothetical protein